MLDTFYVKRYAELTQIRSVRSADKKLHDNNLDYRGEVCVILINHSATDFVVKPGERIAQAVFNKFTHITWNEVDKLDTTERGEGGFGHTGKQ